MLRERLPLVEYLIATYFFLQALDPFHFTLLPSLIGFVLLSLLKFFTEGLRTTYILTLLIQFIILLIPNLYIRLILATLVVLIIRFFPIYRYPDPMGKYQVGYKGFTIPGETSFGVYYPTTEKTQDVQYSPCPNSNQRFADIMKFSADFNGKKTLPEVMYKLSFDFLRHQYLGVNKDAKLIPNPNKFPVIIFSHGLSANIHLYSLLLKEWASNGFIIFSVDHDEEIDVQYSKKLKSNEKYLKLRNEQLQVRKKTVLRILDMVSDPSYIHKIFNNQEINLDYSRLFLAGHSFGGGTTAELATEDKRITGGLVLLDPWFESNDENLLFKKIKKPILVLRSEEFETNVKNRRRVMMYSEVNSKEGGLCLAGYFKVQCIIHRQILCYLCQEN